MTEDVETIFNASNYELEKRLPKGKIEKVIGLVKDELGLKVMISLLEEEQKFIVT